MTIVLYSDELSGIELNESLFHRPNGQIEMMCLLACEPFLNQYSYKWNECFILVMWVKRSLIDDSTPPLSLLLIHVDGILSSDVADDQFRSTVNLFMFRLLTRQSFSLFRSHHGQPGLDQLSIQSDSMCRTH